MATQHGTKRTDNHDTIRRWAEERNARPTRVKRTGSGNDPGILRLDFPGYSGEDDLEEISWNEFFRKFDEEGLDFIYQERTESGEVSNFNKLVNRH